MRRILLWCGALCAFAGAARATEVERLLEQYAAVRTASCQVRREVTTPEGRTRILSRVHYERPRRLHVDSFMPSPAGGERRRIVSDGERLYLHIEGLPKGFSRPVEALDRKMLFELDKVPGTPMDHLLRLAGAEEEDLGPADGFAARKGYHQPPLYAVLCLDERGRPARIEFYRSPAREEPSGVHEYDQFSEVLEGVWIPRRHRAVLEEDGLRIEETLRITNLTVNEPLSEALFIAEPFFPGVAFYPDMESMLP